MSKRSRSKANIPVYRKSLFCILSPVSRLLPNQPILPSLPRIHESIMQNKPNLPKAKMTLNLCPEKHYGKTAPLPTPKKQTQSNPIPRPQIINCQSSIINPNPPAPFVP